MFTYKKVGGLHHWKIGRLGGSFYLKAGEPKQSNVDWLGLSMCAALAIAGASTVVSAYDLAVTARLINTPIVEVVAVTTDGNEYVIGSGDTCMSAWDNAVIPNNFVSVTCTN